MSKRIPASQATRKRIDDVLNGRLALGGELTELVLLAAQLIAEEALEGEVSDVLGRGYYEHGGDAAAAGYRNGYRRTRLKTAEGAVDIATPSVAGTAEPYRSGLKDHLKGKTEALAELRTPGTCASRADNLVSDQRNRPWSHISRPRGSGPEERPAPGVDCHTIGRFLCG